MRKSIMVGLIALSLGGFAQTSNVNAEAVEPATVQSLSASIQNLEARIDRIDKAQDTHNILQTTGAQEVISRNKAQLQARIFAYQVRIDKLNFEAKKKHDAEVAAQKAKDEAAARAKAKADAEIKARQEANAKAQQAQQAAQTQTQSPAPARKAAPSVASAGGLDMNQTHGRVNIQALANWLATNKGTFSADYWAYVINRESNGLVDAQNGSSGAYGVLQLYGHGEYPGMTLGQQLQMAMNLPASAWAL